LTDNLIRTGINETTLLFIPEDGEELFVAGMTIVSPKNWTGG
jgi:hypothetical protein